MNRTLIKTALNSTQYDQSILVKGWIKTRRDSKGGFSFIEQNDGSSFSNIQIVADNTLPNYENEILNLFTKDF